MSPEQLLGSGEFGDAIVIADLEAGIGTLTRLGDRSVDAVLVVVEPTAKSLEVGRRAVGVAAQASLGPVHVVAGRVRNDEDLARVRAAFPEADLTVVPDDPAIVEADHLGMAPLDHAPDAPAVRALVALAERLLPPGR